MYIFSFNSNLNESKNPSIACLEETYAVRVGVAMNPFKEDIPMIVPDVLIR